MRATICLFHAPCSQSGEIWGEGRKKNPSSYSLSNPLERALLPLTAKHFDTSLLKITGGWGRLEQNDFKGIHCERIKKKKKNNFDFRCDETFFGGKKKSLLFFLFFYFCMSILRSNYQGSTLFCPQWRVFRAAGEEALIIKPYMQSRLCPCRIVRLLGTLTVATSHLVSV